MMPPVVRALPALAVLAATATAHDDHERNWYLEFGAGLTTTDDSSGLVDDVEFDSGYAIDLSVGHEWIDPFHCGLDVGVEAGGYYTEQGVDTRLIGPGSSTADELSNGGFQLGGVVSWPTSEQISFYGGVSVGLATSLDFDSKGDAASEFDFEDSTAAFVAGKLGIRYSLGEDLAVFLQYRRQQSEDITLADNALGQSFDLELAQNIFEVGMRWGL